MTALGSVDFNSVVIHASFEMKLILSSISQKGRLRHRLYNLNNLLSRNRAQNALENLPRHTKKATI